MNDNTELEIYDGPHRTSGEHTCMVVGQHYHRPGAYNSFIRPELEVTTLGEEQTSEDEMDRTVVHRILPNTFDTYPYPALCDPMINKITIGDNNGPGLTTRNSNVTCESCLEVLRMLVGEDQEPASQVIIDMDWVNTLVFDLKHQNFHSAAVEIWKVANK
jgi:hypothetical protein